MEVEEDEPTPSRNIASGEVADQVALPGASLSQHRNVLDPFYGRQVVRLRSHPVLPNNVAEEEAALKRPLGRSGGLVEQIDEGVFEEFWHEFYRSQAIPDRNHLSSTTPMLERKGKSGQGGATPESATLAVAKDVGVHQVAQPAGQGLARELKTRSQFQKEADRSLMAEVGMWR